MSSPRNSSDNPNNDPTPPNDAAPNPPRSSTSAADNDDPSPATDSQPASTDAAPPRQSQDTTPAVAAAAPTPAAAVATTPAAPASSHAPAPQATEFAHAALKKCVPFSLSPLLPTMDPDPTTGARIPGSSSSSWASRASARRPSSPASCASFALTRAHVDKRTWTLTVDAVARAGQVRHVRQHVPGDHWCVSPPPPSLARPSQH